MTNLCKTCEKTADCIKKGIFERETCNEYEPASVVELLDQDEFVRAIMVGFCPKCGSKNACSCEDDSLLEDITIGHCLDCETYWCLECGYIWETVEKEMQCPHWGFCYQCSDERGYLGLDEFIERVCPTCEHYDSGCQLEDPSKCDKEWQLRCPYESDVSECPKIQKFLQGQT